VVALVHWANPAHSQLILAGTTNDRNASAVEYVRDRISRGMLQAACGVEAGELKPFEALLRVRVARGAGARSW